MKTSVAEKLSHIEQLVQNRNYAAALGELASIDSPELSKRDHAYYCILVTEASLCAGKSVDSRIDDAIDIHRYDSDTQRFAWAKFLKGWLLTSSGKHLEAREVLIEAYANYLRCENLAGAARALNRLSFVYVHSGSLDSAIDSIKRSVGLYRQTDNPSAVLTVSINLGFLLVMSGALKQSIAEYRQIRWGTLDQGEKNKLIFHVMSALPHALKGDIGAARKTIAKCKPYLDKYIREKAIYFENLGLIEILAGNHKAAEKALQSGLKISLEIAPESALISQIKRLFGDLYIATEKFDTAENYAQEALSVAKKINERVEIAACHRVFAQVERQRGHDNQARVWFQKAIDTFDVIGSHYELAMTRYLAAVSGLYANGERHALLYMARDYFDSEDVKHYVEKIDSCLRKAPPPPRPIDRQGAGCPTIIAESSEMKAVISCAELVAQSDMTVLLTGATGTGKDILARYIHYCSGRKGEFVSLNTAAVPNAMIESELFGYKKGAYTGADQKRVGLIEQADKGTLYLNEIADSTVAFQAKLLEVLETHRIRRLGENQTRAVDFRLLAATNHDLRQRMGEGSFRLDLYHRLKEIRIRLPALDDRPADLGPLVEHFLTLAGFDPAKGSKADLKSLVGLLLRRSWPGNVRELQNVVKRLWLASRGDIGRMIQLERAWQPRTERERLLQALSQTGWNRREAGRLLGVSEGTIRKRIQKHNLSEPTKAN